MKQLFTILLFSFFAICLQAQNWTWMKGSSSTAGTAVYGTKGTEAAANTPGARKNAATFKDASGNIWIFGGVNGTNNLNDLWRFNITTNNWTWMSGSNTANSAGSTTGTIEPSARNGCGYTVDANGDFYIYGGQGRSSTFPNTDVYLYDIFKYTVSTGLWTNISEGNLGNTPGINSNNTSGYFWPCLWVTSTHLYAFAGNYTIGTTAFANRMHKYNFATNTWSSVSAGTTLMGSYNGEGTTGYPSARYLQSYWTDNAGNFWMFGGFGRGVNMGVPNVNLSLNDLWRFNPTTETWTQINSDNNSASAGNYGTINVAAATNRPPNLTGASVAAISNNTFLLFGGTHASQVFYNHSWTFNTTSRQWTWVGGGNNGLPTSSGVYGTQGTANSANIPGTTESHTATVYGDNYYVFGGNGGGSGGTFGVKNTLMRFDATALIAANVFAVPTIANVSSSNVFSTRARINYSLNANNANTTSTISYGTSSTNLNTSLAGATASGSGASNYNTTLTGLQPNTTYFYQVSATNAQGNATPSSVMQFTTAPPAPTVSAISATNIASNFATLNYTVNANGTNSFVDIVYGTTSGNLATKVNGSNTLFGNSNNVLTKDLFNLAAQTTYFYRIIAININGDSTISNELSFSTTAPPQAIPVISAASANTITNNTATIAYTINANGANTTPVIRYGTSSANLSLSITGTVITGNTNTNSSVQLTGLTLGTQYFYRVEASNSGGNATPSATNSFTTLGVVLNAPVNGLVAYYGFNNSINSHNGNHNMTSFSAPTYGTGKVGNGVIFSNSVSNTLFNNTLTNDLPSTGPFTICFWKKNNLAVSTPVFPTFFEMFNSVFVRLQSSSNYSSLERGYAYTNPPSIPLFAPAYNTGSDGTASASSTNWEHYAFVHNPGGTADPNRMNLVLYVNGVLRGELNIGTAFNIHKITNGFTIGGGTDANNVTQANKRFDGSIDEFYVYNRVLTPTEIANIRDEQNAQLLPLTLTNFSGNITNQTSQLNWQTANEVNVSHFEVEYSNNGNSFAKVSTVNAKNNSSNLYTATHLVANIAKHYYRLKMVDKDGSFTYSTILQLQSNGNNKPALAIHPTTVKNTAIVSVTANTTENATISLVDMLGKVVERKQIQLTQGTQQITFSVSNLQKGMYTAVLMSNHTQLATRFVKE
jgi:hypothetical protein